MNFFFLALENARKLEVNCPSSVTHGMIQWNDPGIPYSRTSASGLSLTVEHYLLQCVCLHGKTINVVSFYLIIVLVTDLIQCEYHDKKDNLIMIKKQQGRPFVTV